MHWLDQKYIGLVQSQLLNFHKIDDNVWNFRCVYCGDSKTDRRKRKAYLYVGKKQITFYKCHKCQMVVTFGTFLKHVNSTLHKEYLRDTFSERGQSPKKPLEHVIPEKLKRVVDISRFVKDKHIKYGPLASKLVTKVSSLPAEHFCKKYVLDRKIPNRFHAKLFFTEKFKTWTNEQVPGKFEKVGADEARLIIPFVDMDGNMFGYQGRSFTGDERFKYISIFFGEDHIKVFGLDDYDPKRRVYITEGPIDSMFIENGLAMAGASMDPRVSELGIVPSNTTRVYDNERRNKNIVKQMEMAVEEGYKVFFWPDDIEEKDINDLIKAGKTVTDIREIIDTNAYEGLQATLKITQWKRT